MPVGVCLDLLFMHYIFSFLVYRDRLWPEFRWQFKYDPPWELVASLWYTQFYYVMVIMIVLVSTVIIGVIVWIIYSILFTDDVQCDLGLCSYFLVGGCICLVIVPCATICIWFML